MNAKDAKDYRCYTYFYISSAYIQLFFNQFTEGKGCRPHLPSPALRPWMPGTTQRTYDYHRLIPVIIFLDLTKKIKGLPQKAHYISADGFNNKF